MSRRCGVAGETLATLASATLVGVACCGSVVIQWLGLLVWAVGGRLLLVGLVRYEIPILGFVAAAAFLGRSVAADRLARWANTLLAGVALLLAALRLTWEVRRGVVMAVDPIYVLFNYRQTVLLVAAGLVFVLRATLLIAGLRQRLRSPQACSMPGTPRRGSRPTWT